MKKELIFPVIIGIIIGALIMIFWQFSVRLNNMTSGVSQLEQATAQNSKTVGSIVNFINKTNKSAASTTSKK